jgi:hypothetical protein
MKKIQFLLIAFSLFSFQSRGQSNFQTGLIVRNNGDTLRGFIDEREWSLNPSTISFKENANQPVASLEVNEISYFEIDNRLAYKRFVVVMSMNSVHSSLQISNEKPVTDTVFLRLLLQGRYVSLYKYRDNLKERFFVEPVGTASPYELTQELKEREGKVILNEVYKSQLTKLMFDYKAYSKDLEFSIRKSSYSEKSIMNIARKINGDLNSLVFSSMEKGKARFYFGAGVIRSDLTYSGGSDWDISSQPSYSPVVTAGLKYLFNPKVGKWVFRTELSFHNASMHTFATNKTTYVLETIDYTFDQSNIGLALLLDNNFYNKPNFKIFGGVGIRANFSSYSNNLYTIKDHYTVAPTRVVNIPDFFKLRSSWYSLALRVGTVFNNRFECFVEFNPDLASRINDYFSLWSEMMVTSRLGFNYCLTKK